MEQVERAFKALGADAKRGALRSGLRAGAKPVLQEARRLIAVDSGVAKRGLGISVKLTTDGRGVARIGPGRRGISAAGGSAAAAAGFSRGAIRALERQKGFYAVFIEYGTSQQPARPFLRPALQMTSRDGRIQRGFYMALQKSAAREFRKARLPKAARRG